MLAFYCSFLSKMTRYFLYQCVSRLPPVSLNHVCPVCVPASPGVFLPVLRSSAVTVPGAAGSLGAGGRPLQLALQILFRVGRGSVGSGVVSGVGIGGSGWLM